MKIKRILLFLVIVVVAIGMIRGFAAMKRRYHYEKAKRYYERGELEHSFNEFQKLSKWGIGIKECKFLGELHSKLKNYEIAKEIYETAKRLKSKDAEVYFKLARVYHNIGEHNEAVANYKKAISLDPDFKAAYFGISYSLAQNDRYVEKIYYDQKAIERFSNAFEGYANLAASYRKLGDYEKAKKMFQKAIERNKDELSLLTGLGTTYILNNEYKQAISIFKKVLENDIENYTAYCMLAILFKKLGDNESSQKYIDYGLDRDAQMMYLYIDRLWDKYSVYGSNNIRLEYKAVLNEIEGKIIDRGSF